eukprot:31063-Pelagococcus_subviridis.AAC.1
MNRTTEGRDSTTTLEYIRARASTSHDVPRNRFASLNRSRRVLRIIATYTTNAIPNPTNHA